MARMMNIANIKGPPGPAGASGLSSDIFRFRSKTNAQSGDPSTGRIQWSEVEQITSTRIDIDYLSEDNLDVKPGLATLVAGHKIYIQEFNVSANFQEWLITGATDNGSWFSYDVELIASGGNGTTNFTGNLILAVQVIRL